MESEVTKLADTILHSTVWGVIIVFMMVYIITSIVKSIASSTFQYIMLKTDNFGIGSVIEYNKTRYVIRELGFRRIALENTETRELFYIATKDWNKMILVIAFESNKPGD